nr:putative ribonuclease H-like domain-containing protein [Tanacetum cinerariifolium]
MFEAKGEEVTKVDARQDVKKDVSSLRYIVLPNWVHEEHLESTSSQPQDACNTDAPESSGNSNPTVTSTNPPADQLETLTVETPIPTVSSPVPTVCFTDSQEPSSKTRLILERVANQVETPSPDNIITLTNRFEEILGVTSNEDESNGVEADVSNMETTITASPTPTLKIHRDHPKSQIIGPVDTPIQTRNKSKESLVDCPKGVRPIRTKWVLKNKKDERGIVIRNKARVVAQGHTQEEGIDYNELFTPVARIEAIRLFLAYASFMGFTVYQMDVKSAFLYGIINEEVYVMQPLVFQDLEYPARVYKVEKAMYGLHQAPRAWCDNEGEFRNKEMNDFCSRKGIKIEFSNVRTPQQNGVAERRNRTLIEAARTMLADAKLPVTFWAEAVNTASYKFEAKGDEGYFIGYSMSSKAFRVFNKRTRRVEENLHVDFLENKAIEKGAGPNWIFDIDSLTKSMNYVPVDAGTNSTNLSGTKDAASQEVKKDVSSLRYIALPNWVHDALLESSSMETLIPTVSSSVPTACLNDSQEPLSDTRLISKRVANQVKTPSLDNILTLTNWFEDILGVTTNSVDSDRAEADVSNMETTITASPTPTLRIHKDHPKKPKNISDALQDPSWVEAMQEQLLYFKIQNVWTLVDCPKGEERIDYDEVFAPVKRIEAIRLFLAYASFMGFTVYQMDVKSAFLYGTIDEEVEFEALMHENFQMSVMGELNFFLGLQVLQKEDGIFHSQDKYIGDILKKFGYSYVRSSNTPMDKENPWGKDRTGKDIDLYLYRSMIGSLMYLIASRPDIMLSMPCEALSKSEHNIDFHPMVDFVEVSPLRYALTFKHTIYVSHIRQFWSTARIETTEEGTQILATVDGVLRIVTESSFRRILKLQDEEGISSFPNTELFENLTLMGYNISPNQKFT